MITKDEKYLLIVRDAIHICANYKPKFGQRARAKRLTLAQFRELYQRDAFYP